MKDEKYDYFYDFKVFQKQLIKIKKKTLYKLVLKWGHKTTSRTQRMIIYLLEMCKTCDFVKTDIPFVYKGRSKRERQIGNTTIKINIFLQEVNLRQFKQS